jgi:cold shock CspA family protein
MPPSYLRSFSTPACLDDEKVEVGNQDERQVGVVTRICSFKYGFIQTPELRNIFFHFSELSDEAKAVVEAGCTVQYNVTTNEWTTDRKMKAIDIKVVSPPDQNAYKDMAGVVNRDLGPRGFGFIQAENTTYFFPSNELVPDDECNKRGNTARAGDKVIFDASWNHKYNPPKPYATNVRLVALEEKPILSHNAATRSTTMNRSNSAFCFKDASHDGSEGGSEGTKTSEKTGISGDFSNNGSLTSSNGSWRNRNRNNPNGVINRGRTHARGSSLASLIPHDAAAGANGLNSGSNGGSNIAPAVGRTSGARVNRVTGTLSPYGGDSNPSNGGNDSGGGPSSNLEPGAGADITGTGNTRAAALKNTAAPVRVGQRPHHSDTIKEEEVGEEEQAQQQQQQQQQQVPDNGNQSGERQQQQQQIGSSSATGAAADDCSDGNSSSDEKSQVTKNPPTHEITRPPPHTHTNANTLTRTYIHAYPGTRIHVHISKHTYTRTRIHSPIYTHITHSHIHNIAVVPPFIKFSSSKCIQPNNKSHT